MHNLMVIGLDGAPWRLIKPWIEQGELPFLKRIIDNGTHSTLRSTVPPLTSPALPSLYTGVNPGKHGLFDFMKYGKVISSKDIVYLTIWKYLDKNNKKSIVFNWPITYPPVKLNGIMVSASPVPNDQSALIYPRSIERKFDFPKNLVDPTCGKVKYSNETLLKAQKKITKSRFSIFKSLIKSMHFDFAMYFVKGTDTLQHRLWDSKKHLREYYVFLDKELSKLYELLPDWNFFILSDHGFEAAPSKYFHINTWLEQEGYLKIKGGRIGRKIIPIMLYYSSKILPSWFKSEAVKKALKRGGNNKAGEFLPGVDWESTAAYQEVSSKISVGGAYKLGIHINSKLSHENYEIVREELIKKLSRLKDKNGKNVIREAWKREEIYSGPCVKDVPDIVIVTEGDYITTPILSEDIISNKKRRDKVRGLERTGGHHSALEGIFIAHGPDIKEGKNINGVNILDIAPSILHMYSMPVPKYMDGRVFKKIFREESDPARRNVNYEGPEKSVEKIQGKKKAYSREDEEKIKEKLRSLGYLD